MANNYVDKSTLEEEMKVEVDSLKAENDAKMDTIRTLEVNLEKAESNILSKVSKENIALSSAFEKEVETCKELKKAITNLHTDVAKLSKESDCAFKILKSKEKEIYNMENKTSNLQDRIVSLKEDLATLKDEKLACEKQLKVRLKKDRKNAKNEVKGLAHIEVIEENQNVEETTRNIKGYVTCDVCLEYCPSLTELKEHRENEHQEILNYNCKLCADVFKTEVEHKKHTNHPAHILLSKSVSNEFSLQIGKICNQCLLFETEDNTTYNICDDDDHLDIFEKIWGDRFCGSMPILE